MARLSPQEFADKYVTRAQAASTDYVAGVQRVTQAPGQKAAAAANKAAANYQAAITSGNWARNVGAVGLQEWQQKAVEKGGARYAPGAAAAHGRMVQVATRLLPHIDAGVQQVKAMPKNNLNDSIARATKMMQHMAAFKGKSR